MSLGHNEKLGPHHSKLYYFRVRSILGNALFYGSCGERRL